MSALVPLHQESHLETPVSSKNMYFDLSKAAVQTGISFALEFLPDTITIYFLSQTGNQTWVGAFGYGYLMCRAFGLGVLNGLACGLETLVSQAFGAAQYALCCKLYYRALFVSTLLMVPIALILALCEYGIALINDNTKLVEATGMYARYMIPAVWLNGIYVNTKVFLNGQNIYNLQMYTQGITCFLSAGMNYFFILYLDMGLMGSVVSRTLLECFNISILYAFVKLTNCCSQTWIPFKTKHLKSSMKFLKSAIPIGTILWFEWVCYEFYMMQASYLSEDLLSANVIMSNWAAFYYQFSYGISIAATTFVGIEMGKREHRAAIKYAQSSLIMEGLFLLITLTIIYILKRPFSALLTNDEEVQARLVDNMLNMLIMITCDGFQGVLSGLVRGVGKEKFAAATFVLCYVGIGQVVSYLLCFTYGLELKGIWIGMISGAFLYDVLQVLNLLWKPWSVLSAEINEKMLKFSVGHSKQVSEWHHI